MVRGFAFHESVLVYEFFNKEATADVRYLVMKRKCDGADCCKEREFFECGNEASAFEASTC
jgi:hypothetical protein